MNYLVSDFVSRIKNAALAHRKQVVLAYSKLCKEIGINLVKEKVLEEIKEEERDGKKVLVAKIRYVQRNPVFSDLTVVSKPSLRVYIKKHTIHLRERKGIQGLMLSTSKGVMSGKEAKKQGLGGELLFEVW